jgi:hypothetical protein
VIRLKSGYCSPLCMRNVTLEGWKAMKGESVATRRSIDYDRNAAQLYASEKGWHIGGKIGKQFRILLSESANEMHATEKGRFMRIPYAVSDREYLAIDSLSQPERDGSEGNDENPKGSEKS